MIDVLNVEARDKVGSANSRRLRATGMLPGILYGHGEGNLSIAVPAARVEQVIRHGGHVVHLEGAASGEALIKAVQWDALGTALVHIDLMRVVKGEKIKVSVGVETKGDAPGATHGGVVEIVLHEVELECPVVDVPDHIICNVSTLDLGGSIHAGELQLPAGAKLLTAPETVVVHCVRAARATEETPVAGAEPEVVAKKTAE